MREQAHDAGYLVPVFRYPAVQRGRAGLRLMPNIDHTEEHINGFATTLRGLRESIGF